MTITCLAPAKINLMLHVVGRMPDGYHHLQSLVAFTEIGDEILVEKADQSSLTADGPFADQLSFGAHNSIVMAAQWLGKKYPDIGQIHIHLTKNLPISSGIGGGSSDAAATIAALLEYHKVSLSPAEEDALILASGILGADVPLCLAHQFGRGPLLWIDSSGRETLPIPVNQKLPGVIVLVNPGVAISTPDIFEDIHAPYTSLQDFRNTLEGEFQGDIITYLKAQTNDLMTPAMAQVPVIGDVIGSLQNDPDCRLARMSGSGATCFGLFEDEAAAKRACAKLNKKNPSLWINISSILIPNI